MNELDLLVSTWRSLENIMPRGTGKEVPKGHVSNKASYENLRTYK